MITIRLEKYPNLQATGLKYEKSILINFLLLATALEQAKELKDPVAESHVMGELGYLYEQNQQYSEALNLTQKALKFSENLQISEMSANLYWQQGRILKIKNDTSAAITSYNAAIDIIESLRQDLVAPSSQSFNKSFYFRQRVEPVYRQTVELLLQNIEQIPEAEKQKRLEKSLLSWSVIGVEVRIQQ